MIKKLNKINLPFLNKIDRYFLLNKKLFWVTRVHYVTVFGIATMGLGAIITLLWPVDYHIAFPNIWLMLLAFSVPSFFALCWWVYYQVIYNVDKENGLTYSLFEYRRTLLYLYCIIIFGVSGVLPSAILSYRIGSLVKDNGKSISDVSILNLGNPYFPTSLSGDNIFRVNRANEKITDQELGSIRFDLWNTYYNDFETENNYYGYYSTSEKTTYKNSTKADKYYAYIDKKNIDEGEIERYIKVINKYGGNFNYSVQEVTDFFKQEKTIPGMLKIKKHVQSQIEQIHESRVLMFGGTYGYRTKDYISGFSITLSILFALALLLQIFNNMGARDFIWSVVFTTIISITTLIIGFSLFGSDDSTVILCLFVYSLITLFTLSIFKKETYSRFKNMCLAFSNVFSPLLILLICVLANAHSELELSLAMIGGIGTHFLFLTPLFRSLHVKMQTLPRK